MPASKAVTRWTCADCEVTASWAADAEKPEFPQGWTMAGGKTLCLNCRREQAGQAGADAIPDEASNDRRSQAKVHARIEFEVLRDPHRRDNAIAKACHTSVVAVRKARERLGVRPGGEV